MSSPIEVRVHERGTARDSNLTRDAGMQARCELCSAVTDAVVSVGAKGDSPYVCKNCLRDRLEAITVALWQFRDPGQGLPWGKISG